MDAHPGYSKYVDLIGRDEFVELFSNEKDLEDWFSTGELEKFSFPKNAGSLAARYLVKKRICDFTGQFEHKREIQILNDDLGKPEIIYGENIRNILEKTGVDKVLCSLSHSRNFIVGMTVFIYKDV